MTAWLARRAARRGLTFRVPTQDEVDAFAEPTARILTHHLPLDKIDGDLVDLGRAARAAHDYVTKAPLYSGRAKPAIDNPNPQE